MSGHAYNLFLRIPCTETLPALNSQVYADDIANTKSVRLASET